MHMYSCAHTCPHLHMSSTYASMSILTYTCNRKIKIKTNIDKHIQLHTHMYANAYAHMGTQACECIFMNSYMHIYT